MISLYSSRKRGDSFRRLLLFTVTTLSLFGLCACATTGDPSQGGLFGWNRTKASERQDALRKSAEDAIQSADQQSEQSVKLEQTRTRLLDESKGKRSKLNALLMENSRLEKKLKDATKRGTKRASDLAQAHKALSDNREKLASLQLNKQSTDVPASESLAQELAQQNARLLKFVLLLSE